jgi:Competence protein J (ComJ)
MATISFALNVSHSQIAVFDSTLGQPFNMWTEKHVNQGFAWRPGSVSCRTIASAGRHRVELLVTSEEAELPADAVRIIQVPFEVSSYRSIEIASIADAFPVELSAGSYALRYECFRPTGASSQ